MNANNQKINIVESTYKTEATNGSSKLNLVHIAKARLLRQKLREKKRKSKCETNPNIIEEEKSLNSKYLSNNVSIEHDKEKIDPLNFKFSIPEENRKNDDDNVTKIVGTTDEKEKQEFTNMENNINNIEVEAKDNTNMENINQNQEIQVKYNGTNEIKDENVELKEINNEKIIQIGNNFPVLSSNNKNKKQSEEQNHKIVLSISSKYQKEENKALVRQYNFQKYIKQSDSEFSSSSDDDFEQREEQRLMNIKIAQDNLFKKIKIIPKKSFISSKKKKSEITSDDILQKLFLDLDKTNELLELNEKKKRFMLNKMRRTLHRLSNLRFRNVNPEEEEKRHLIKKKIEELKSLSGDNYYKIKENVEKITSELKMPDFYFADDEDVEIISDKQEMDNINVKFISDDDFSGFMLQ